MTSEVFTCFKPGLLTYTSLPLLLREPTVVRSKLGAAELVEAEISSKYSSGVELQMRSFVLCVLLAMTALSLADCGCGAKCATYTDPSKCTRCCTATVKRSLPAPLRRSHRFLLPQMGNPIRVPMWLAAAAASSYSSSSSSLQKRPLSVIPRHRRHRSVSRRLLDQILSETVRRNI